MNETVRKHLENKATLGDKVALFRLSSHNAYPGNLELRFENLVKSANLNYPPALYILACLFEGHGFEFNMRPDFSKSKEILQRLVRDHKHEEAEYMLEVSPYIEGVFGTQIDISRGIQKAISLQNNSIARNFIRTLREMSDEKLYEIYEKSTADEIKHLLM